MASGGHQLSGICLSIQTEISGLLMTHKHPVSIPHRIMDCWTLLPILNLEEYSI